MCILKNGDKMYVFHKRKKNLVLKEKYFQYFMKIKGEIRPSFKQIPLQKCHKIFLHIFPFLNILHSFSLFQKKNIFLRLTLRVDRASLTQV